MKQLTILVDMDDVLEHLVPAWIAWLNERHGTSVKEEDMVEWELEKVFPMLTHSQVWEPLEYAEFWDTVRPVKDAAKTVYQLMADGHEVYVVTHAPLYTIVPKIERVLFRYFPFIDMRHVIFARNKQMIRGDILIDDGPHNLIDSNYISILMDRPHNRNFDNKSFHIIRVHNWQEIYELVCRIANDPAYSPVNN